MTNQAPYKTMGFCATCERYTEHHCSRCQEHDTAMLPRVDLALVKEVQDLRAQNERLVAEKVLLTARLANISDFTLDGLNRYGAEREMLQQIDAALNGDYDPEGLE